MFVNIHIYRVQFLSQFPIPGPGKQFSLGKDSCYLPKDMSGHLGLPLPGEDPLLVARNPPWLLLGHEVCEVPNVLA